MYEELARELPAHLNEKGRVYLEIGYMQGASVSRLMQEAFPQAQVEVIPDFSGKDRIIYIGL